MFFFRTLLEEDADCPDGFDEGMLNLLKFRHIWQGIFGMTLRRAETAIQSYTR